MALPIIGYLARSDWEDPEDSVVVAIEDCAEPQVFRVLAAEWCAKENTVHVVTRWMRGKAPIKVRLGESAVDSMAECSLKFCATEALAIEWLGTQSQS
ncbi:MAG: hypothetical protein NTX72_01215 [Candidatus Uhrbacteria bacterium]|nr:hypothetical protein [Candidatus Uhrbacteria bacterium]